MLKCTPTVDNTNYNKQWGVFCCYQTLLRISSSKTQRLFTVKVTRKKEALATTDTTYHAVLGQHRQVQSLLFHWTVALKTVMLWCQRATVQYSAIFPRYGNTVFVVGRINFKSLFIFKAFGAPTKCHNVQKKSANNQNISKPECLTCWMLIFKTELLQWL